MKLTKRQKSFVYAYENGATPTEIARRHGVTRQSVWLTLIRMPDHPKHRFLHDLAVAKKRYHDSGYQDRKI